MRRLGLLLAVLLLAAAVTAPAATARLVRYDVAGGIGGFSETLIVNKDGDARQISSREGTRDFTVGPRRLRALKRDLRRARFRTLKRNYEPVGFIVFDGISQSVRYSGRTISVSTGAEVPARLERVLRRLDALMR